MSHDAAQADYYKYITDLAADAAKNVKQEQTRPAGGTAILGAAASGIGTIVAFSPFEHAPVAGGAIIALGGAMLAGSFGWWFKVDSDFTLFNDGPIKTLDDES